MRHRQERAFARDAFKLYAQKHKIQSLTHREFDIIFCVGETIRNLEMTAKAEAGMKSDSSSPDTSVIDCVREVFFKLPSKTHKNDMTNAVTAAAQKLNISDSAIHNKLRYARELFLCYYSEYKSRQR